MQEVNQYMADSITDYCLNPKSGTVMDILNPHQQQVLLNTATALRAGTNRGYVKAPTGFGKTVIQAALAEATDCRSLVVVPRITLVEQSEAEFRRRIPRISVGTFYSRRKDLGKQLTVTTYPSWDRGLDTGAINPADFDVVMYDEGHHLLAAGKRRGVQRFDCIQIGFTATPGFGANRHLRDLLPEEFYNMSIRKGVENDLLCSFSVFLAKTEVNLAGVEVIGSGIDRDFNEKQLAQAVNITSRNKAAVDMYKSNFPGMQGIAYCVGVGHAETAANEFRKAGVRAAVVSSYQKDSERKALIKAFKNGEIDVLCNANLLIEGFDAPNVSVVINLRPTLSPVVAEQRGGRALRVIEGQKGKYAFIIDFIDETSSGKQPISFAQVAEAARIVNKAHTSEPVPHLKTQPSPTPEALGIKFITEEQEVMWAVDEDYAEFAQIDNDWKTLRRISAETGVDLDALIFSSGWGHFSTDHELKIVTSPLGHEQKFFHSEAIWSILEDVLESQGRTTMVGDENTKFDPLDPNVEFKEGLGFSLEVVAFLRRLRKKIKKIDVDFVHKYTLDLRIYMHENKDRFYNYA